MIGMKIPIPSMIPPTSAAGAVFGLGALRKSAEHPREGEKRQEDQSQAGVNNGEHFSGLERCDSFYSAGHRRAECSRPLAVRQARTTSRLERW